MKYEKLKELLSDNEVFTEFIRALPNQEGEKGIADGEKVDDAMSLVFSFHCTCTVRR